MDTYNNNNNNNSNNNNNILNDLDVITELINGSLNNSNIINDLQLDDDTQITLLFQQQQQLLQQQQSQIQQLIYNNQQAQEQQYQQRQIQYQQQYNQSFILPTQLIETNNDIEVYNQIPIINVPTIQPTINNKKDNPKTNNTNTDVVDKEKEKRNHRNLASKKSKEKKKDYLKQIEEKVEALKLENKELLNENQLYKGNTASSITSNGSNGSNSYEQGLVFRPGPDFNNMITESNKILIKLEKALKEDDEISLIYLLHIYHGIVAKRFTIVSKEIDKFVSPFNQLQLAEFSYTPAPDPLSKNIFGESVSDYWISQFKKEGNLSDEQSIKFDNIVKQHQINDKLLIEERKLLDSEIKDFYYKYIISLPPNNDNTNIKKQLNVCDVLEFIIKLVTLKNKTVVGRIIIFDTLTSICSILTPKQEALLLVKVSLFQQVNIYTKIDLVNEIWNNVNNIFNKSK